MRRYAYFDIGTSDRRGPDHLVAVHRRLHDRATAAAADGQGPGDRHRQRISGGRAQQARVEGLFDRDRRVAGKTSGANAPPAGLQERRDENRRRLSGLGRTRALRQDHRHLLAGERSQAARRATQGGRPVGGSPGATLPADPVPVQKGQRRPQSRAFAADVLRADDGPRRRGAGRAGRRRRTRARQRRLQECLGRSAGRLVLHPPRQGRDCRPDAGRRLPLVSQRIAGPGGASLAGGGHRRPTDPGNRNLVVGPRARTCNRVRCPSNSPSLAVVFFNANRQSDRPICRSGRGPAASTGSRKAGESRCRLRPAWPAWKWVCGVGPDTFRWPRWR